VQHDELHKIEWIQKQLQYLNTVESSSVHGEVELDNKHTYFGIWSKNSREVIYRKKSYLWNNNVPMSGKQTGKYP